MRSMPYWINGAHYGRPMARRSLRCRLRHCYYRHEVALWILASVVVVAAMAWAL